MNKILRTLLALVLGCLLMASAQAALDARVVKQLVDDDSDQKIEAIAALVKTGTPEAARLLQALSDDALYATDSRIWLKADDKVYDAVTGTEITPAPDDVDTVTINNRVRGTLDSALAGFKLFDPDPSARLAAAQSLQGDVGAVMIPALTLALQKETDSKVKPILEQLLAQANLKNPDVKARLAAVEGLTHSNSPNARGLLLTRLDPANEPDAAVREAAKASIASIDSRLAWTSALANVFSGLSLGSILLLAALGLAITYGVMGVINMAHGELLMVGAYSAYFVQGVFRNHFPGAQDWYLVAAVPVSFFAAAFVGMVMERTVIRWLYGRPLETLLATWGVSLVLIQGARTLFGAQNVEVSNPSWMSGGIELLPSLTLPWNRIVIIGFALSVLVLMWAIMQKTRLGLFVRAVTQNRPMAGCVGVPTSRVDTLAFGLGAGIAGLGGLALSQIANVGPDMGQGYIVDSFLVVVLGGVGQLAGAVWAALGLGIATKLLEGWAGAVIAKIIVLAIIIIFIQRRPQGLFAVKGRVMD
ncbi:urea ABC transporter permease subunit UrtB [Silvimonas soli]|uniref:urea ABC transporter permease subunit UrtB n=1 Tax=Silvimonas soli TaxID=2980100 RepID=UPI0024B37C54|nr:urea ABC transporter permease subunit UrtB [Silvimonas soli]